MRVRPLVSAFSFVFVVLCAAGAGAQTAPATPAGPAPAGWGSATVRLGVNAGLQAGASGFTENSTLQIYQENAPLTVAYGTKSGLLFDGSLGVHVKGRFGLGVAMSYSRATLAGQVHAGIPNPFVFGVLRPVDGTASGLRRTEIGTHLQALYLLPMNRRVDLMLSGGPSILYVQQDLVTNVNFSQTYPYDTATFQSATLTRVKKSAVGFNVGVDLSWRLTRRIGVGAMVRYTRATVSLPVTGQPSISAHAGGFQAGAGLRLMF
ncbi:MAG TPA: outer membrane beta-barrel protein [Vicinamibacterales bacterium]|nr:outer membrane beta-barrel protein [Vicinamibacterales bacterium]